MPVWTAVVWGSNTFTFSDVLLIPATVGEPTPEYPIQKLVEEAVPPRVKTQFNAIMAVLIPELMYNALVLVLATTELKLNATLPRLCADVVEELILIKGLRIGEVLLLSKVEREHRFSTEVPPTTRPNAFADIFKSTRSNSINPTFVVIQLPPKAALDWFTSTFVM
jgi:hypothetical protein